MSPQRVEKHEAVGPVEAAADAPHHVDQRRLGVDRQLAADLVHDDFRVVLASQVMVAVLQQLVAQCRVVGQLAVEGEAEPLVLPQVVPLEGLRVTAVVAAAGGVAHVADGRQAGIFLHECFAFAAMCDSRNTSLTDPTSLCVSINWSRDGSYVVIPAASWPRF